MAPAPSHGGSFRVLRTARVTPSSPAGDAVLPERALPLTFMDAIWLCQPYPVERVFFYLLGPGADVVDVVLSRLADSLSLALHAFYPLAGRVRLTPGKTNRYELFYQPGDGVAFTVAEHDGVDVDELATDHPREAEMLALFVPKLPEGGAVLAVQATVLLPSRRGLALGVTVHHAACDGASSTHFLHTWAAACAGVATPPPPPVISRTFIHEREDIYDSFATRLQNQQTGSKPPDVVGKLFATFTLSRENLQSVKDIWNGDAARRGVPPPRCTSIVAMFSVIWQCFHRATPGSEAAEAEPDCNSQIHLVFPVDLRTRLEPRVPDKYLGNCIGGCFASAQKKELIAVGVDGLIAACSAVAAAIEEATRYDPDYWKSVGERSKEVFNDGPPLTVAGSPRFRVYDVDFGFGRPAKVEIVSVAKTGAIAVAEGRGSSGGIEVGIALPLDRMETFRRCFVDAVAWLSSSP